MWPQGWNNTAAFLSEQTTHSSICKKKKKRLKMSIHGIMYPFLGGTDTRRTSDTLVLDWTWSLQMRHFLTRGEQREQVAMCPQGPNRVSLFMSEHTIHSSSDSILLFRDGLRVPTWPLQHLEGKPQCVKADYKQEMLSKNTENAGGRGKIKSNRRRKMAGERNKGLHETFLAKKENQ